MKIEKYVVAIITMLLVMMIAGSVWSHQTAGAELVAEVRAESGEVEQVLLISIEDLGHYLGFSGAGGFPTEEEIRSAQQDVAEYINDHAAVFADGDVCELVESKFNAYPDPYDRVHFHQQWQCPPGPAEVTFVNRIMLDSPGGYRHMSEIHAGDNIFRPVFDRSYPTYSLYPSTEGESVDAETVSDRYMVQGFWHILLGFDHILFILALLFAVRRCWPLVAVVTAFTVGHSVTLAVSALDIWTVSDRVIEPLIAVSILYVAARNILSSAHWNHVWILAVAFGLIHGFGFSYILRGELPVSTEEAIPALLAFNLGVEIGHLVVVATVFPIVYLLRKHKMKLFLGANRWVNAAIAAAALFWMIERVFFG